MFMEHKAVITNLLLRKTTSIRRCTNAVLAKNKDLIREDNVMKRFCNTFILGTALLLGSQTLYGQTCNGSVTATAPNSRYTDNGDGTVTDNQTGLMWKQCSEGVSSTTTVCDTGSAGTYTWQDALTQARIVNSSGFAGHNDWRVPNYHELASLIERSCYSPAINATIFPVTESSFYWSASPDAYSPLTTSSGYAWKVSFALGKINTEPKESTYYVRLVRNR